jgi:ankyrin repeat protein
MGADINVKKNDGSTLFHMACENNDIDLMNYLIEKPKILINRKNNNGDTPLLLCALQGNDKIYELLITKFPQSITIRNDNSENILHKASISGNKQIIYVLATLNPVLCCVMLNEKDVFFILMDRSKVEPLCILL